MDITDAFFFGEGAGRVRSDGKRFMKPRNIIYPTLFVLTLGSLFLAISSSEKYGQNPHFPDQSSGYIIPLSIRGIGTVYLNQEEWLTVAPYWDAFYICLVGMAAVIITPFLCQAYVGFMQGWRRR